jgi:hypothetical protein
MLKNEDQCGKIQNLQSHIIHIQSLENLSLLKFVKCQKSGKYKPVEIR